MKFDVATHSQSTSVRHVIYLKRVETAIEPAAPPLPRDRAREREVKGEQEVRGGGIKGMLHRRRISVRSQPGAARGRVFVQRREKPSEVGLDGISGLSSCLRLHNPRSGALGALPEVPVGFADAASTK